MLQRGFIAAVIVVFWAHAGLAQTPSSPDAPVTQSRPSPRSEPPADETAVKPPATSDGRGTTPAVVVGLNSLEGVVGKSVRSASANEDMGRIVDILVDGSGQLRAAVIDFGGFLGVGSRKVAVDWKALEFVDSIKSGNVKVALTRDQIRQSPEYKSGEPVVILQGATAKAAPATPNQPVAGAAH